MANKNEYLTINSIYMSLSANQITDIRDGTILFATIHELLVVGAQWGLLRESPACRLSSFTAKLL